MQKNHIGKIFSTGRILVSQWTMQIICKGKQCSTHIKKDKEIFQGEHLLLECSKNSRLLTLIYMCVLEGYLPPTALLNVYLEDLANVSSEVQIQGGQSQFPEHFPSFFFISVPSLPGHCFQNVFHLDTYFQAMVHRMHLPYWSWGSSGALVPSLTPSMGNPDAQGRERDGSLFRWRQESVGVPLTPCHILLVVNILHIA